MITIRIDNSKKCNGDWSLYVTFPYDSKIVDVIRSMPSRFWNKETKEWELPIKKLGELTERLSDCEFDIYGANVDLSTPPVNIPNNFKFKTQPFSHQVKGFEYGLTHDRWLLGDEQGLGKTKQVIDIAVAKKQQERIKHCLIVCGVNGLKWNWVNEIHTHSNEEAFILGQKWVGGRIKIGTNADKLNCLDNLQEVPFFLITNVESLRNKAIADRLKELCKNGTIDMVAIDEIHKCKNPSSQQGKGILKLEPKYRIAMTGTPLMNNPLDLYIILRWLGYEKHAFYSFKNHYCLMGGYGGYEVIGYKNLEELQEQLEEVMIRRLKQDVLDLPEKTRINEYVEMTPKQAQIYKEVKYEIQSNIDQIKMSNNPLAELIRLRQATGYTGILSSTIKESAKLDRMEELVEEAMQNGKKVVIFSNWTQITDAAYDRLLAKGFVGQMITGDTEDESRQLIVDAFQNSEYQDFIIGTIGAMGTGITLTAGTIEIFMDEPWNMALKEQAEDRCHRVGTKENITIYTLLCKDTIDERINEIVERKGKMANLLVDGGEVTNKLELIDYLLG